MSHIGQGITPVTLRAQLTRLVNQTVQQSIREGLVATYSFSQKPQEGYQNYYDKMTQYIKILEDEAHALDPNVTAKTFPVIPLSEEESVFCYMDSASSRAGITTINDKLRRERIAIVGLGGTGAYILDLVSKTPVGEIHLFDDDVFLQHNAFRSPGAPSVNDLAKKPKKVAWFAENYSRMRRKIVPHPQYIDEKNVSDLQPMEFVFLCLDKGKPKQIIVNYLIENKIPFIDVGIGLNIVDTALIGLARITTYTPSFQDHLAERVAFSDGEEDNNEYSTNIQIADMNMLNAALAVIKWKKLWGFYIDSEQEFNTVYGISSNLLTNEVVPNETKPD
jgi:hypothetical protein